MLFLLLKLTKKKKKKDREDILMFALIRISIQFDASDICFEIEARATRTSILEELLSEIYHTRGFILGHSDFHSNFQLP